jgi:hypothetical protein
MEHIVRTAYEDCFKTPMTEEMFVTKTEQKLRLHIRKPGGGSFWMTIVPGLPDLNVVTRDTLFRNTHFPATLLAALQQSSA